MITTQQALSMLQGLVGQKAWGAAVGEGSFVTLEFGAPVPKPGRKTHGEWHVWVYGCAWRIDGSQVAGSNDDRDVMEKAVAALEGRTLTAFDVDDSLEATLTFGDLRLRLFPVGGGMDQWMVFTPAGRVITAGAGNSLVDEPA